MPQKMKNSGKCKCNAGLHMPFQDGFDERDLPFVCYLEGKKQTSQGSGYKNRRHNEVPDTAVDIAAVKPRFIKE